MNFDKVTAQKLKDKYESLKSTYKEMWDYYAGETKIDTAYPYASFGKNQTAKVNYIKKFINEHVAFGTGVHIQYTHSNNDSKCIEVLEKNIRIQKSTLDSNLMKQMLIFGRAYELAYIYEDKDKNQYLKFKTSNPLNSISYCNDEGEVEMFLYFYKKELNDQDLYFDCYCDDGIYKFKNSFDERIDYIKPTGLGVPVSVAQLDDDIIGTMFSDIKELQDCIEIVLSNWVNNESDFRDAYFKSKGVEINEEFAEKVKKLKIFELPEGGDIDFITKNANPEYVKNLTEKLIDILYQVAQAINSNEQLQSNTSSVAILSRIINLRNKIGLEQKCLADAIKNRLRILFKYVNALDNKDYDYRDINIIQFMNVPNDDVSMANIISQLSDKLSIEDGLNQLSFVQNGRRAFEKMLAEKKEIAEAEMSGVGDINNLIDDPQEEENTKVGA